MSTVEYRLVIQRPEGQQGRRPRVSYPKRSLDDALRALGNHARRQNFPGWDGWVETRTVTDWDRIDDPQESAVAPI